MSNETVQYAVVKDGAANGRPKASKRCSTEAPCAAGTARQAPRWRALAPMADAAEAPPADGGAEAAPTDAAAPAPAPVESEPAPAAPAAPAPMADTPAGIWKALGIQDEPTEMAMLARQQAIVAENAITCLGRNIHGIKVQATKTKSELTQAKQVQSVHTQDIEELKRQASDNSAIDDLKAEIAAMKKQAFEVRRPLRTSALPLALRLTTAVRCRTTTGCRRS